MYNIGDKIVYPMHGAGVIVSIEEKEILGKRQKYYIMKMPIGEMKVMIPIVNIQEIGVRNIVDIEQAEMVMEIFRTYKVDMTTNWNKRYRENMFKIKSGNICEVAHVVKCLICREKVKGLSTSERKMLNSAKQILISELVLVKLMHQNDIECMIEELIVSSM